MATRSSNTVFNVKQVPASFAQANSAFSSANNVAPQVQPAFDTANSSGLYANSAFVKANAAFNSANNVAPQIQPAFSTANSAALYANGAFAQANGAFSNTNLNVSGTLKLLSQGGDEGGEIFLGKATTNTTLAAGITVDVYQNKLRIFENGGGLRGAFIDIANTTANGVGSEIMKYDANNSSTGLVSLSSGTTAQRPSSPQPGSIRYNTTLTRIEAYMPTIGWREVVGDTYSVEVLIVAGGGGGGNGTPSGYEAGGGGGGGLKYYGSESNATGSAISVTPGQSFVITVGAGGGSSANGGSSSFGASYTTLGGGYGGPGGSPGASGGSGGGGGHQSPGGAGTPGQGNPGGGPSPSKGGAGGGAGGAGPPGTVGNGGLGLTFLISGSSLDYAGGGLGALAASSTVYGGAGTTNNPGTANRGGGGGGAYTGGPSGSGGAGGSGIVIVRYLGSQRGTGGTISSSGGYTIHTFTGSGTFTA